MDATLLGLIIGAAGGLVGGNIFGALFHRSGNTLATNTLIGLVGGALAVQFFADDIGSTFGAVWGGYDASNALAAGSLITYAVAGAGGGAVLAVLIGLLNSVFARN